MNYLLLIAVVAFLAMQSISLRYLKTENLRQNLLANGIFCGMIAAVFGILVAAQGLTISAPTWIWGGVFGIAFISVITVYYYAMQAGPLSYSSFFLSASMIVPVLLGVFVWKEKLTDTAIIGILLFLIAFYFISVLGGEKGAKINLRWLILCLLSCLCNGLCSSIAKQQQLELQGGEYQQMMFVSFASAMLVGFLLAGVFLLREKDKKTNLKADMNMMWNGKVPILGAAVGSGISNAGVTYLASRLPGAYLYPIALGGVVVVTGLFSAIVLKEKLNKAGVTGILIGIVAIVVLNL